MDVQSNRDATTREELLELLPTVHPRLERLDVVTQAATAYLWRTGTEQEREALDLASFRALLRLDSVHFSYYGDVEIWLGEEKESLFDGCSLTVYLNSEDEGVDWAMNA